LGSLRSLQRRPIDNSPLRFMGRVVSVRDFFEMTTCDEIMPELYSFDWRQSGLDMSLIVSTQDGRTIHEFYISDEPKDLGERYAIATERYPSGRFLREAVQYLYRNVLVRGVFGIRDRHPDFPHSWILIPTDVDQYPEIGERRKWEA
jgi:hypothetical protein